MPEHHTKQGYARMCASVPCKLMVFHEIWRFPVFPSLEDTVIYLQLCIFYKLFFITCPPCWNFLLQNIPLRSDFCKSESLFSRKKERY